LQEEGAGGGFGEVARAGRLDQASGSKLRRRSGAGLGGHFRRRSPLGLVRPDRDCQAPYPTCRQSTKCQGGLGRPPVGLSGPCVSSHRTRVRKASQRFVSLKAFSTEETNQRFRQSRAKLPSSNQWIITQPTPCLLRLRASKGVLSRENVNSSAVSGNTMRGAARVSGLGREFDRHRQGERWEILDQQTEPLATGRARRGAPPASALRVGLSPSACRYSLPRAVRPPNRPQCPQYGGGG
jgi:hypothetical protein